jgi:hypothetical protein
VVNALRSLALAERFGIIRTTSRWALKIVLDNRPVT